MTVLEVISRINLLGIVRIVHDNEIYSYSVPTRDDFIGEDEEFLLDCVVDGMESVTTDYGTATNIYVVG